MGMCFGSTWSAQSWGKLQRSSLVWEELTQCLCCGSASSSAPVVHLQRLPITSGNLSDLGAGLTQPLGATFTELTIRKAINRGLRKQLCSLPAVILHLLPQGSTQTSPKHYSEQLIVLFWTNVRLPFLKECSEGNKAAASNVLKTFSLFIYLRCVQQQKEVPVMSDALHQQHHVFVDVAWVFNCFQTQMLNQEDWKWEYLGWKKSRINWSQIFTNIKTLLSHRKTYTKSTW